MSPLIIVLLLVVAAFVCTFGLGEWLAKRMDNAARNDSNSLG